LDRAGFGDVRRVEVCRTRFIGSDTKIPHPFGARTDARLRFGAYITWRSVGFVIRQPAYARRGACPAHHLLPGASMKKLHLDVDALEIESFEPGDAGARQGTVLGHNTEVGGPCGNDHTCVTCVVMNTCLVAETCNGVVGCYTLNFADTCARTCGGSCWG
jgi:hypothetical protein